jgi:hypothetical protein
MDLVATSGFAGHENFSQPAEPINFEKHLIPGELGQTVGQGVQVTAMRVPDGSENAIGDGRW